MPSARLWGRGNSVQPPFFPKMGFFFIPLIFRFSFAIAFWRVFFGQHVSPDFSSSGRSVPAWKVSSSVFFCVNQEILYLCLAFRIVQNEKMFFRREGNGARNEFYFSLLLQSTLKSLFFHLIFFLQMFSSRIFKYPEFLVSLFSAQGTGLNRYFFKSD